MFKKSINSENNETVKAAKPKRSIKKFARIFTAIGFCLLLSATALFAYLNLNKYSILDANGNVVKTGYTFNGDARNIINNAGYSANFRILSTAQKGNDISIKIEETFPVHITYGDTTITHITSTATVEEIIINAKIALNEKDMVSPELATLITGESYIDIIPSITNETQITVTKQEETEKEEEKPSTSSKPATSSKPDSNSKPASSSKPSSSSAVAVNGALGNVTYPSGDKKAISELIPSSPIELDANGVPVNYKSSKRVQATAYTHTGNKCSTGVWPKPGYIAVDPKVIPYGTKMYIVSADGKYVYGYAIAADTGGFIKKRPTNVDLFMHTESACRTFGRRDVIIYFL